MVKSQFTRAMGGNNDNLAVLATLAICVMITLIVFFTVATMFTSFMCAMKKPGPKQVNVTQMRRR